VRFVVAIVSSYHPPMVDVLISSVQPVDVGEILTLQRAAYVTEAQLYSDASLSALTQTYEELAAELGSDLALKVTMGHRIVGSVRARLKGSVLHIGRLMVAPDLQGRGIGTRLLTAVEREAAGKVDRYMLFTGHLPPRHPLDTPKPSVVSSESTEGPGEVRDSYVCAMLLLRAQPKQAAKTRYSAANDSAADRSYPGSEPSATARLSSGAYPTSTTTMPVSVRLHRSTPPCDRRWVWLLSSIPRVATASPMSTNIGVAKCGVIGFCKTGPPHTAARSARKAVRPKRPARAGGASHLKTTCWPSAGRDATANKSGTA
jgi:GNAT superfamily N-acetyltransferase